MIFDGDFDLMFRIGKTLVLLVIWLVVAGGIVALVHFLFSLPLRRAERARLFLDLIETGINRGQPIEEMIVSVSHSRERSVGVRFHRTEF